MTAFTMPTVNADVPGEKVELCINFENVSADLVMTQFEQLWLEAGVLVPNYFENVFSATLTQTTNSFSNSLDNEREAIGLCSTQGIMSTNSYRINKYITDSMKYPTMVFRSTLG